MRLKGGGRAAAFSVLPLLIIAAALLPRPGAATGDGQAPAEIVESESYVLRSTVFVSAGAAASSASYGSNGTMGQPHPVGLLGGSNFEMYAGFWNWTVPVTTDAEETPLVFKLAQNYPNPFNPVTTIDYSIPGKTNVDLTIYDVSGRKVRTLVRGKHLPGGYSAIWDGRNDGGRPVATGVYFYRLTTGRDSSVRKMVILR
jgi:hypothetical protein